MSTTTLLVDILIIGAQIFTWIFLFISSVIDPQRLTKLVSGEALTVTIAIIISYVLGTVFDTLIDRVFKKRLTEDQKEKIYKTDFIDLQGKDYQIASLLNNRYEKIRIARGTTFNLPFITISLITFVLCNSSIFSELNLCLSSIIIILIGTVGTLASYRSYKDWISEYVDLVDKAKAKLKVN
jgi:hypothetical protein